MSGQGQKMKSFNINPIGRRSKQIKQKKEDEEKAAAEAFEEFVATFEEPPTTGKLFVRGTVINAGSGEEKPTAQTGKLYKPPKLVELPKKEEGPPPPKPQPPKPTSKKKEQEKKKSNLELFKEELKIIQEEREERHRLKNALKDAKDDPFDSQLRLADDYRLPNSGSYDTGDPNTTNIYLGNLNPKMSEQELCELFGRFGPLASVKIMWPRSEEERSRGKNCGFVAYMNRKDGERAMKTLNNQEIQGFEMKLGWGKAVPIPPHPIYIPPALQELTLPPPPSGLPFNAQPEYQPTEEELRDHFDEILANSVVKVVIPSDRNLLMLIHRMIEFVVREGPMFEAMIMNREINNPMFRFLYENQTPAHVYYRWRLFSILQGEHPNKWRQEEFYMFEGGSLWRPPPLNPYLMGMPESLVVKSLKPDPKKGALTDSQRDQLEDLLRNLTPDRNKIAEAMVFCIEHAECAEEVMDCIYESLSILETPLYRKVARIYLISDILHNCTVKVNNASYYRKGFEGKLPDIFKEIRICFKNIEGRLKAEQFKQRVMNCFRAWEDWAIYPNDFLIKLQNIFLGLEGENVEAESSEPSPALAERDSAADSDLDGLPLAPEELDGVPISDDRLDIDGMPLTDDLDGQPLEEEPPPQPPPSKPAEKEFQAKFKPSKWETVDPETMAAQAITTSKWDLLDQQEEKEEEEEENVGSDIDGEPMDPSLFEGPKLPEEVKSSPASSHSTPADALLESVKADIQAERRAKLRDIEVKVMKFQDELESGKRSRKAGMTIADQVEHYRKKLLRKEREKLQEEVERERRLSPQTSRSPPSSGEASPIYPTPKVGLRSPELRKRSRSRSPRSSKVHRTTLSPKRHHRSRSRSPKRRRSRSRSPGYRSRSPSRKSHKSSKRSKY